MECRPGGDWHPAWGVVPRLSQNLLEVSRIKKIQPYALLHLKAGRYIRCLEDTLFECVVAQRRGWEKKRPNTPWDVMHCTPKNCSRIDTDSKDGPKGKCISSFKMWRIILGTLPKFNSSPLKSYLPNRTVVFQASFFRDHVKLREGIFVKFQGGLNLII